MAYISLDLTQKQIRLLHLAPSLDHESRLECSFSLASFDGDINYEALSYVWGDVTPVKPIGLEGKEVLITKNLHSALSHLRYKDRERILWADALCINQSDMVERTHQVSLMSSIFSRANLVVAYLGDAWEGCEVAMDAFRHLGSDDSLHLVKSLTPSLSVHGMGLDSAELRDYLIQFFGAPWWNRLWTVQEYALAKQVVFQNGRHVVYGELLLDAITSTLKHYHDACLHQLFTEEHDNMSLFLDRLWILKNMDIILKGRTSRNIIHWISFFASREATDPRDKIYGLLGLATGNDVGLVEADYSCSFWEVAYAITVRFIERNQNLDILSYLVGKRSTQLPSFVPDWMNQSEFKAYSMRVDLLPFYSASGNSVANFKEVASGKLAGTGILVDTILDHCSLEGTGEEFLENCRLLFEVCQSPGSLYRHTGKQREVAWWLTMCGEIGMTLDNTGAMYRRVRDLQDISAYQKWESWLTTPPPLDKNRYTSDGSTVGFVIKGTTYGRCFISTEKGYVGWAPKQCKKGDVVAVLAGGKVPYVLRPEASSNPSEESGDSRKYYSVLGDAYIHGIMDGEVVTELEERGGNWEEIVLV
ncbi:heterokaryon incompatibility protein-domain-containing protein [Hyaloscypha finlandica]|nr:heterokaryon incompatibility protein-domain-containing protein [Hyaloscypha finlandica]